MKALCDNNVLILEEDPRGHSEFNVNTVKAERGESDSKYLV